MSPVTHDVSTRAWQADALFASALQRGDEPSAGQVRRAVDAAVRAFGYAGCAGRVAQEFGDHPDVAAARMRWARAAAGSAFPEHGTHEPTVMTGLLLGAIARQALGDPDAARKALEHAAGLVEDWPVPLPFPVGQPAVTHPALARRAERRPHECLTHGESRVLRYLPSHLSTREIAAELYLSANTVKTHQRHLYAKLGAHSRAQAVERARVLGLLASPPPGSARYGRLPAALETSAQTPVMETGWTRN